MHPLIESYQQTNQFGTTNGLHLEILAPGHIRYTLPIQDHHLALPKVVHGGVIAGMMDAVLSVAGLSLVADSEQVVGTVEFKINYLAPAAPGDVLTGEGKVVKSGKRLLVTEGSISNQEGQPVAIGTGTLNAYPAEKSGL